MTRIHLFLLAAGANVAVALTLRLAMLTIFLPPRQEIASDVLLRRLAFGALQEFILMGLTLGLYLLFNKHRPVNWRTGACLVLLVWPLTVHLLEYGLAWPPAATATMAASFGQGVLPAAAILFALVPQSQWLSRSA